MDFNAMCFVYLIFYVQSTRALGEDAILLSFFKEGNAPSNLTQLLGNLDTMLTSSATNVIQRRFTFLNSNLKVLSIACDQGNDKSFIYEISTRSIYRLDQISGPAIQYKQLHRGTSNVGGEITYDWFNRNLYWTDREFQWIILQPAYTLQRFMYKVVVDQNLAMPYGVTVDSRKGFLFWSDIANNPVIEKSNLAGYKRESIVTRSLSFPNSLIADEVTESLFWTDWTRETIEACSYTGENRRILKRISHTILTSIALYKDIVCAIDPENKRFSCHKKTTGDTTLLLKGLKGAPWALALYDSSNKSVPVSACQSKSCEDICVAVVDGIAKCLCFEGFTLNQDGRTCSSIHGLFGKGLLISNTTHICMLEIRIISQVDNNPECILYQIGGTIIHIETDTKNSLIFYGDNTERAIRIHSRLNKAYSTLISTSIISGMAYDWIHNNLFWTESDTGRINVISLKSRSSKTVFSGLFSPKELTIDPHNRTLYWIESDDRNGKNIQRGKMDGTGKKTIVSGFDSSDPNGLYFNTLKDRLFWEISGALKSCLTDGTDIKYHLLIGTAKHLSVYKGYVISTTGTQEIRSWRLSSKQIEFKKMLSHFGNITGMVIFDPAIQRSKKGLCEVANGGCQQICVALQAEKTCQCSLGFTLQADKMSCSSIPIYDNFLLTTDISHNKIYQINLDEKNLTALDLPNVNLPIAIAYNHKFSMVIWSEKETGQIRQSQLTGENASIIYNLGYAFAYRLSIDFSTNNVYFSQNSHLGTSGLIRVVKNGVNPKTLVRSLNRPGAIALYPSKGYLFFSDFDVTNSYIGRCYMDGSSYTKLVIMPTQRPNGLALDYVAERLFWTDGYHNKIESMDLNGGDKRTIFVDNDSHMKSLVLDGTYLYYTAWSRQKITKVNKNTKQQETWMKNIAEFGKLESLDIYNGKTHPVNRICSIHNGQCSTYCLPTTSGRTCACEDDVDLGADERTCQGVKTCKMNIPNGAFERSCLGSINNFCQYNCDTGYRKNPSFTNILCSLSGVWNPATDQLCSKIRCTSSIPNGVITSCDRYADDVCSYRCNSGYRQNTSVSILRCVLMGHWSVQLDTLCEEEENKTTPNTMLLTIIVGTAGSCFGLISVVTIMIVMIWKLRQQRNGRCSAVSEFSMTGMVQRKRYSSSGSPYAEIDDDKLLGVIPPDNNYQASMDDEYLHPISVQRDQN